MLYGFEMSNVACELGSLSNWLQECIKLAEATSESNLVIILDDIQNLKSVQTSALLGWLPWSLPSNVHLICSVNSNADSVLSILRSRIPGDNFLTLNALGSPLACTNLISSKLKDAKRTLTGSQWAKLREQIDNMFERKQTVTPLFASLLCSHVLSQWTPSFEPDANYTFPANIQAIVHAVIDDLTRLFGENVILKLCTYLTYTRYGLRESEIVDLVASELPEDSDQSASAVWQTIKEALSPLMKSYYVLARPYLTWSHEVIGDAIKTRSGQKNGKAIHAELAAAFNAGFCEVTSPPSTRS